MQLSKCLVVFLREPHHFDAHECKEGILTGHLVCCNLLQRLCVTLVIIGHQGIVLNIILWWNWCPHHLISRVHNLLDKLLL
jgi:hypothetical protein